MRGARVVNAIVVIPARWASSRFPGKALYPIGGRPLLWWVVQRVRRARCAHRLLVATDDERIRDAASGWGIEVALTSPQHPSGTDRVAEAVQGWPADVIVNVQGDEPLIEPDLVDRLIETIAAGGWDMATAAAPLDDPTLIVRPSVVKVVVAADGRALYFSRAPIPYDRDGIAAERPADVYRRHIGVYAYTAEALRRFVASPPSTLEQVERLEQLRALDLGFRIAVLSAPPTAGLGVDTPDDVPQAEAALRAAGLIGPNR